MHCLYWNGMSGEESNFLVPKLCLGIVKTEAPASTLRNEAELQEKTVPKLELGNQINPGLKRPGYFRQSLRDAVSLPPRRGRANLAHCFNGGH